MLPLHGIDISSILFRATKYKMNIDKIKNMDFKSKEFWNCVDALTVEHVEEIICHIGGKDLLSKKYKTKIYNCKSKKLGLFISEIDYAILVYIAGISLHDIGRHSSTLYNLARLNDEGPYARGNCRFIPFKENKAEQNISLEAKELGRVKTIEARLRIKNENPDLYKTWYLKSAESFKKSEYVSRRKKQAKEHRSIFEANSKKPYLLNENNPQYGSFWITNGTTSKKWRPEFGEIPDGFYKGRI